MADEIEYDDSTPIEVDEDAPVLGFSEGGGVSFVDVFREELKELAEAETCFIPVKGYERTGLQIRYAMPENGKQLDNIARKVTREFKDAYSRNLYISIDTMIVLCDGVFVQPQGVEEPVMLDPEEFGQPCQFDERLAQIMGMNGATGSARQVVKHLFGGNELAIMAHSERLSRWLQNTKADLEAEIWQLGE